VKRIRNLSETCQKRARTKECWNRTYRLRARQQTQSVPSQNAMAYIPG